MGWKETRKKPPKVDEPVLVMWFNKRYNVMDLALGYYGRRGTWFLTNPVTGNTIIPNGPVVAWRKVPWANDKFFKKMEAETKILLCLEETK